MTPSDIPHRDRLIVALDLPGVEQAEAMVARLGDGVNFYKIGYQLVYAGGLPLVRKLADQGKKVFIDLKLHDIGNTVARGVENIAKLGATFLTVHAYPQTMKAAVEARAGTDLKILAVTVLTSYDDSDLHAAGYRLGVSDLVEARAQQAQVLGIDGLVCSPEEATAVRKVVGHQMRLVTPGIRPAGAATGGGKRAECLVAVQGKKGQDRQDELQLCLAQGHVDCLKQAIDQKVVGPQRKDGVAQARRPVVVAPLLAGAGPREQEVATWAGNRKDAGGLASKLKAGLSVMMAGKPVAQVGAVSAKTSPRMAEPTPDVTSEAANSPPRARCRPRGRTGTWRPICRTPRP